MDQDEFIARLLLMGYTHRYKSITHTHMYGQRMFSHEWMPYVNVTNAPATYCRVADLSGPQSYERTLKHLQRYIDGDLKDINVMDRL